MSEYRETVSKCVMTEVVEGLPENTPLRQLSLLQNHDFHSVEIISDSLGLKRLR